MMRGTGCRSALHGTVLIAAMLALVGTPRFAQAQVDPAYDAVGPIDVQTRYQRPSAALYVSLEAGQSFQVVVTHEDDHAGTYERYDTRLPIVVLSVTGPDERLIHHRVVDTAVAAADYPGLAADDLAAGLLADHQLQAAQSGIHTIRMSAAREHTKLHVGLPPGAAYGVHYGNGVWQDWRASQDPLYLWIPRHGTQPTAVELRHERGSVTVWGPNDDWSHTLSSGEWTQSVAAGEGGELWRLDGLSADWQLRAGAAVPIIAVTSAELAQSLNASMISVASGPLAGERVPHAFQQRIAEQLVPQLLELIGNGPELRALVDPTLAADGCVTAPDENAARQAIGLVGRDVPAVTWALDSWRFGSEAASHPFADVEHTYSITPIMARLSTYEHPCNPWGPDSASGRAGRPELVARAALSAMTHLLDITEDGRLGLDDWSNYPGGGTAFAVGDRAWPFALLAERLLTELPAPLGRDVLDAYTEGLRRLVIDRRYAEGFVTARNQSAFYVPSMMALAQNRGEPQLETIARAYAERFAASADPAGWFPESLGPDATYNGITHAELAHAYVMSTWLPGCSDSNLRDALQTSYRFFNATVAPEPDGSMLGGFNFSHRTNWGFYAEQFGGARSRARDIQEVAIWSSPEDEPLTELQADLDYAIGQFDNRVERVPDGMSTLLSRFLTFVASETYHYPADHGAASWPAEDPDTDQLLDDDLYVVRRNGFYAVVYVGHPIHDPFYTDKKVEYMRRAAPPAAGCPAAHIATYEDTGTVLPAWNAELCPGDYPTFGHVHPFVGGGLSLVWTPAFGAGLLAANWSPVVHHGLVGLRDNPDSGAQERTWEAYAGTVFNGANRDLVEMAGTLPMYYGATDELDYTRQYSFSDDAITVDVTVANDTGAAQSFDALWENVPVPVCDADCDNNRKGRVIGFAATDGTPLADGEHSVDGVHVVDSDGHGLAVELAGGPRLVGVRSVGMTRESYGVQLKLGRLEIPLAATTLADGESTSLQYVIRALDPVSSVPAVPTVTDEPEIICGEGGGFGGSGGFGGAGGSGAANGAAADDDGGCGCRTPGPASNRLAHLLTLAALALAAARRRRGS